MVLKILFTWMNLDFAALLGAGYFSSGCRAFAKVAFVLVNSSRSADLFGAVRWSWCSWMVSNLGFFPLLAFLFGANGCATIWNAFADVALVVESLTRVANFLYSFGTVTWLFVFYCIVKNHKKCQTVFNRNIIFDQLKNSNLGSILDTLSWCK